MASRRKKSKHEPKGDGDPLGGFSLDQLMGFDLISEPPGPSKTATIFGAPFRLAGLLVMLPFRLIGGLLRVPARLMGRSSGGRKQAD